MNDDETDHEEITTAETPVPSRPLASGRGPRSVDAWPNAGKVSSQTYTCGHCGKELASNRGFYGVDSRKTVVAAIYICHGCNKPTYIHDVGEQTPAPMVGDDVEHLSGSVATLYWEARVSASRGANTAAAMCCRKLLLNVAAELSEDGDFEPDSFKKAVDWLEEEGHIPKKGKRWVDEIRKVGNEVNHEIDRVVSEEEADRLLTFTEGLLTVAFELPHKLEQAARTEESGDSPP